MATRVDGIDDAGGGDTASIEQDWQASIRARLGMTLTERLLIYGTAGIAFSELS
ncbi:outer membrane protein [Mesorhizobium sp. BHbsci]